MHRIAALLLGALLATLASGAPAPPSRPWGTGWDKPVDPDGDCRFTRQGGKLTITVPRGHAFDPPGWNAPRLLRDVEGDFAVQVRVGGNIRPPPVAIGMEGFYQAGIILMAGKDYIAVQRMSCTRGGGERGGDPYFGTHHRYEGGGGGGGWEPEPWPLSGGPAYIRLERRGDVVLGAFSQNGKNWVRSANWPQLVFKLPPKVKVGVIAESSTSGEFKPVFDQFKLTKLTK